MTWQVHSLALTDLNSSLYRLKSWYWPPAVCPGCPRPPVAGPPGRSKSSAKKLLDPKHQMSGTPASDLLVLTGIAKLNPTGLMISPLIYFFYFGFEFAENNQIKVMCHIQCILYSHFCYAYSVKGENFISIYAKAHRFILHILLICRKRIYSKIYSFHLTKST